MIEKKLIVEQNGDEYHLHSVNEGGWSYISKLEADEARSLLVMTPMFTVTAILGKDRYSGVYFEEYLEASHLMCQLHRMGIPARVYQKAKEKGLHDQELWLPA